MNDDTTILRRMIAGPAQADPVVPHSASRAIRMALTKAADMAIGMIVNVKDVAQVEVSLDDVSKTLATDALYLGLQDMGATVGIIGVDPQFCAAALEVQTTGRMSDQPAIVRDLTNTDAMMAAPILEKLMQLLPQMLMGSSLVGWFDAPQITSRIESPRAISLILPDAPYRLIEMTVSLGQGDRVGKLTLLAKMSTATSSETAPAELDVPSWAEQLADRVMGAPAALDAVLHRMNLPIGLVDTLQVGQILPLYGAHVTSVRLTAPLGYVAANAKLGQSTGKRAVRLQTASPTQISEIPKPELHADVLISDQDRVAS